MAKKAKAKGKDAKSAAPKKVAGVKVPKKLRESTDSLSSLITSPLARELVADALIAIAGALAGSKKGRDTVAKAGSGAAKVGAAAMDAGAGAASAASDAAATATGAVAEVVTDAARRILPASLMGEEGEAKKGGPAKKGGNGDKGGGEERYAHLVDTAAQKKQRKKGREVGPA